MEIARTVQAVLGGHGLQVPVFRADAGGTRRLRRVDDVVIVTVPRGQAPEAVARDCIDGAVAANRLDGEIADAVRAELRAALAALRGE